MTTTIPGQAALLAAVGIFALGAMPATAEAQNCKLHYAEAFQQISIQSFNGQTPELIKQKVDDLFGPRQEVCGESGYKFFLTELGKQAAAAMRKKGSEQESRILATREILNRFPRQVSFNRGENPSAGLMQLRSDLGVLGTEVGSTPSIRALLDALAQIAPPRTLPRPLPKDDDAIPITVPRVPLPAWAIISLYEIRDHAARKENAAITAKSNRILEWVARANPDAQPSGTPATAPAAAK